MLEFIELKVSLHGIKTAKEVKMYFLYVGFRARNTTEHKEYGADFARTKICGKVHDQNFGSFFGDRLQRHISQLHLWVHFIELY